MDDKGTTSVEEEEEKPHGGLNNLACSFLLMPITEAAIFSHSLWLECPLRSRPDTTIPSSDDVVVMKWNCWIANEEGEQPDEEWRDNWHLIGATGITIILAAFNA